MRVDGTAEKERLRSLMQAWRRGLDPEQKRDWDARIAFHLLSLEEYAKAPVVGVYLSADDEVATDGVICEALARGVVVGAPVTAARRKMEMRRIMRLEETVVGRYGLREPAPGSPLVDLSDLGAAVVPGLAFTPDGDRLGYGGGYYDRYLAGKEAKPTLIGLAYEDLVVRALPAEPWDVRMDWIVTPQGIHRCGA